MTYPNPPHFTKTAVVWHRDNSQGYVHDNSTPFVGPVQSIVETLSAKGFKTTAFAEEQQVMQSIADQQASLLIIHLQTSGEQGYALCQALRRVEATHQMTIVFMGARAAKSERVKALRCGGNDYLQLPISSEECWLSLQQHLSTAKLVHQLQVERTDLSLKVGEYSQILDQQAQMQRSLARENQALQKLAFVDGLTQVANRRSFNQNIVQRWQTAYKESQPLSLLLCDIDYFKRYNDAYGHPQGDNCLRAVADALVRGTHRSQSQDQVSRYGGEEFAITLPNTQASGAEQVALSVQSEVARIQMPHKSSLTKAFVSLSIGIFTLVPTSPHHSYEDLVNGADQALYTAKLWGRDRTVSNTRNGFLSLQRNYCLCDYTQAFKKLSQLASEQPISSSVAS
ncbi:MAG: diguanylate cyclase [Cyanobacteria bacterium P01_D01_bin.36]